MIEWLDAGDVVVTGRVWAPGPALRSVWCLPHDGGPAVLVELRDDPPHRELPQYRPLPGQPPAEWVRACRGLPLSDEDWRLALGDEHPDRQAPLHDDSPIEGLFD